MAFENLFSKPPNPILDKNMTDSELAGDEREDGELEDGEIDDAGNEMQEEDEATITEDKIEDKEKNEKAHRRSKKKRKKEREKETEKDKKRAKRRRKEKHKHYPLSSGDSSDYSHGSDTEHLERTHKKGPDSYKDYDIPFPKHGQSPGDYMKTHRNRNNRDYDERDDYSDDKFEYYEEGDGNDEDEEEEDDDFADQLKQYRQAKEAATTVRAKGSTKGPMKKQIMKGVQKGSEQKGYNTGRGRGMMKRQQKYKDRGRGRGRAAGRGLHPTVEDGNAPRKWTNMSQEFINQHTVEHKGKQICKYFLEGRCIKGDQCKFDHEIVVPDKKKEICKFYIQGYCSKGENCFYMHNEFPCKFFHTGAKCYQGDNCKFSHAPLTDQTRELLDKVLNTEEPPPNEDEQELKELRKQGLAPLPKPPPGVGLLPTPLQTPQFPGSHTGSPEPEFPDQSNQKIPSLFEVVVKPSEDLTHKTGRRPNFYNSSSPPTQFQGNSPPPQQVYGSEPGMSLGPSTVSQGQNGSLGHPGSPDSHGHQYHGRHGPPVQQSPPMHTGPPGFPGPPLQVHPSMQMYPTNLPQGPMMNMPREHHQQPPLMLSSPYHSFATEPQHMMQETISYDQLKSADGFCGSYYSQDTVQNLEATNHTEDNSGNWYSSDEEEGSSVRSILKTLKRQSETLKRQKHSPELAPCTPTDSGSVKEKMFRNQSSDPRLRCNSQQTASGEAGSTNKSACLDPRLARDPRKQKAQESSYPSSAVSGGIKVESHRTHTLTKVKQKRKDDDDDEDTERELREKAVLIPLEPLPAVILRDPRSQLRQFSHIKMDITLTRPNFAKHIHWAPEDLLPLPLPKPDPVFSINLPLPPLIADQQLNKVHSSTGAPSQNTVHVDPRLVSRAKDNIPLHRSGQMDPPTDPKNSAPKLSDPRLQKLLDPRLNKLPSTDTAKDSHPARLDPRLTRSSTGNSQTLGDIASRTDQDALPPYAPKLSATGSGLGTTNTLLSGISLYDPRNQILPSSLDEPVAEGEHQKSVTSLKENNNEHAVSDSTLTLDQGSIDGSAEDNPERCNSLIKLLPKSEPTRSPAAPAVHNLPVQALAGLIRPQYTDPRQMKQSGQGIQVQDSDTNGEPDDKPLKDVFKTFDPTASPFC